MSLALWLRTGRTERGLSLDDVARVTKIQTRILERLEGGKLDNLPAEVFVRGFVRSYAKCCGLDESEALTRYGAAAQAQLTATAPAMPGTLATAPLATGTIPPTVTPAARAMVEAMADLAPMQAARATTPLAVPVVEASAIAAPTWGRAVTIDVVDLVEAAPAEAAPEATKSKKKHRGKKRAKRATQRSEMATGTPSVPTPVVVERIDVVEAIAAPVVEAPVVEAQAEAPVDHLDPLVVAPVEDDVVATEIWQPKMPPVTTTASVPWRRPAYVAATTAAASVPTLVIDDADPDSAEQVLEDRAEARSVLTNAQRRSFLPPILLDREDRSARQGGLTLAVIILLIAATLTLSYLMRRPSSSGDGVTSRAVETQLIG